MGLVTSKDLDALLQRRDLRKLRILLDKGGFERVKREWFLHGRIRPYAVGDDVFSPLEYVARGFVDDHGSVKMLMDKAVEAGVPQALAEEFTPTSVMQNIVSPAVRRDILPVVDMVFTDNPHLASLLTAPVDTRDKGQLVQSTILHLAAEQHATKCLPRLLELADQSSMLAFLMSRRDGRRMTCSDVAHDDTSTIMTDYAHTHPESASRTDELPLDALSFAFDDSEPVAKMPDSFDNDEAAAAHPPSARLLRLSRRSSLSVF